MLKNVRNNRQLKWPTQNVHVFDFRFVLITIELGNYLLIDYCKLFFETLMSTNGKYSIE